MRNFIASIFISIVVVGCSAGMPKPNTTGPVRTLGGIFLMKPGAIKYGMTYSAAGYASPLYAKVEFENPETGSAPMVITLGELDRSKDILAQSPQFSAIRNNTTYTVILYVYSDLQMTKLVDTHIDQVRFAVPPETLKQIGVRVL